MTGMSSEEKRAWVQGPVSLTAYLVYLHLLLFTEVGYVSAMLWTIGCGIAVAIGLHIALTVRGPQEPKDDRDREIARFGDAMGHGAVVLGAVVALVLALMGGDQFWIANVIYAGFSLASVLGSTARVAAYRWGLPGRHAW
ncbi:hypothetical protein Ari01nite_06150 [Paractinoplanes rishiriensis]|uniref:DUF2178 domain-containing protein n=2 Tax=Paractinoplanes rishiriensis TaxID=1050105 RepID=A0A919JQQ5_9ACTN|nr:hypothetical protein Ari01nite_06150 [Actinoplanes rishiriensis]